MEKIRFTITDDSGFLAIVNAEKYRAFVKEEWSFDDISTRFVDEMNNQSLIIWEAGFENEWAVELANKTSHKNVIKEFSASIEVSAGKLYLANYEDLTMAAQFIDVQLPSEQNEDLVIELANGYYWVTVKQLNYDDTNDEQTDFEIIIHPAEKKQLRNKIDNVFWME